MTIRRLDPSEQDPRKLTAIIGQAQHVWGKLIWEATALRNAHAASPFDVNSLVYGAINFAITATSLEDWLWKLAARKIPLAKTQEGFRSAVAAVVPMQPAFRDISNTFKHGAHRDENWRGGSVELVKFAAFTDTEKEFVLIYSSDHGANQTSLELFDQAAEQWRNFIVSSGLFAMLEAPA